MSNEDFQYGKEKKAAKPYRCFWCGTEIEKGEKYYREASVFQGVFSDGKFHMDCVAARDRSTMLDLIPEGYVLYTQERGRDYFEK